MAAAKSASSDAMRMFKEKRTDSSAFFQLLAYERAKLRVLRTCVVVWRLLQVWKIKWRAACAAGHLKDFVPGCTVGSLLQ